MVNVYRSYALGSLCVLEASFSSTAATACSMPLSIDQEARGMAKPSMRGTGQGMQ